MNADDVFSGGSIDFLKNSGVAQSSADAAAAAAVVSASAVQVSISTGQGRFSRDGSEHGSRHQLSRKAFKSSLPDNDGALRDQEAREESSRVTTPSHSGQVPSSNRSKRNLQTAVESEAPPSSSADQMPAPALPRHRRRHSKLEKKNKAPRQQRDDNDGMREGLPSPSLDTQPLKRQKQNVVPTSQSQTSQSSSRTEAMQQDYDGEEEDAEEETQLVVSEASLEPSQDQAEGSDQEVSADVEEDLLAHVSRLGPSLPVSAAHGDPSLITLLTFSSLQRLSGVSAPQQPRGQHSGSIDMTEHSDGDEDDDEDDQLLQAAQTVSAERVKTEADLDDEQEYEPEHFHGPPPQQQQQGIGHADAAKEGAQEQQDRVAWQKWQECSLEEWKQGGQELAERFSNLMKRVIDLMA